MKIITQMIRNLFGLAGSSRSDVDSDADSRESDITVERETESATADSPVEPEQPPEPTTADPDSSEPGDDSETEQTVTSDDEPEPSSDAETEETPTPEETAAGAEPVIEINGIGPTYSDRLTEAGIETIGQLADSDPETVAEAAEVSTSRASNWIENASDAT